MDDIIRIDAATDMDADYLAGIRMEAMRPSLEAIGRFDPERAKSRFLDTFNAMDTKLITIRGEVVGFYVVRQLPAHLYLDHLYLMKTHQGKGIGRKIVQVLQDDATARSLPIKLMALKESTSNDFYQSCGFNFIGSEAFDNLYEWIP